MFHPCCRLDAVSNAIITYALVHDSLLSSQSLKDHTLAHTCHCFGLFKYSSTCPLMGVKVDANHGHPLFPAAFVFDRVKGIEGLGQEEFDLVTSMSSLVISEGGSLGLERAYAKREIEVRSKV